MKNEIVDYVDNELDADYENINRELSAAKYAVGFLYCKKRLEKSLYFFYYHIRKWFKEFVEENISNNNKVINDDLNDIKWRITMLENMLSKNNFPSGGPV